ncbi:hypothetical protein CTAM01_14507 [Colletotrichum tamarilloi]|uniref:Uncharacterized protein n=1 Tax=Colletotrichum tamarilloi TaxID=1209934 RepID=A0ABQ9QP18_9PEZI|nr:uncharacterized protein CTAM01_14507 [Colletotrichum tamarilloi]KAK1479760.1 hypothetical protein CTAM01_14507 [Colletotrichum tamarilloi]
MGEWALFFPRPFPSIGCLPMASCVNRRLQDMNTALDLILNHFATD